MTDVTDGMLQKEVLNQTHRQTGRNISTDVYNKILSTLGWINKQVVNICLEEEAAGMD